MMVSGRKDKCVRLLLKIALGRCNILYSCSPDSLQGFLKFTLQSLYLQHQYLCFFRVQRPLSEDLATVRMQESDGCCIE